MSRTTDHREFVEPASLGAASRQLAAHWTDGPIEFVRRFDNLVYRAPGPPPMYLRITSGSHRSKEQIQSELQVVRHVADCGVSVGRPVPSRSGELVHSATVDGAELLACMFQEVPGTPYERAGAAASDAFFRRAGNCLGTLHGALSTFERPQGFQRFIWTEDRWERFASFVPDSEKEAWELYAEINRWTGQLTRDPTSFGLIHGDFTVANLRIDGELISLFDFDACCDHWRAYEIAAFLHYFGAGDDLVRRRAYECTLHGYAQAYTLSPAMINQIPMFGKMRLLYSFLVFAEEWGFENLNDQQRAYFEHRRRLFAAPPTWPHAGANHRPA